MLALASMRRGTLRGVTCLSRGSTFHPCAPLTPVRQMSVVGLRCAVRPSNWWGAAPAPPMTAQGFLLRRQFASARPRNILVEQQRARSKNFALYMLSVAIGVAGLSYAAVPLYKVFCQVGGCLETSARSLPAPSRRGCWQTGRVL